MSSTTSPSAQLTKNRYQHPYAEEIARYSYPQRVHEISAPLIYNPPEETSAIFVDTEQAVQEMLQELKGAQEIAVDLEHHEYRSYYGIVSLMQISTRNQDWIVDTLRPWREKLQVLNEVFTDPNIVKVFHGSSMDIIWLQRDLGLYVVGLFDTYYACEALQFPGRGLKFLLSKYANFEAQKQYQMADWRIRPLPWELIDYARSDTHYLLYIYDMLRNELVQQSTPQASLIDHVLQGSKKEAIQTYTRFIYNSESGRGSHGWYNLFTDNSNSFDKQQFAVFRALHEWRDKKAREEDEGLSSIFPNRTLWVLAEQMPINQTEVYKVLRPMPQMIAQNAGQVFEVIRDAKRAAEADPLPYEMVRANQEKYGIPHNRWKKYKEEKAKTQLTGVGATLKQLSQNGAVGPGRSSTQVNGTESKPFPPVADRAQLSDLWGKITTAISDGSMEPATAMTALQSILPLPNLTTISFGETNGMYPLVVNEGVNLSPTPQAPQVASNEGVLDQVNDIFTLKQRSRKRKADDLDDGAEGQMSSTPAKRASISTAISNGDTSPTSPDTVDALSANPEYQAKRVAKQKKKSEKRARKAAKEAEAAANAANTVPFDYEAAENIITNTGNGRQLESTEKLKRANQSAKREGKGKAMNPFAKALDTTTGAKRSKMGKEQSGRSMTFQS